MSYDVDSYAVRVDDSMVTVDGEYVGPSSARRGGSIARPILITNDPKDKRRHPKEN